MGFEFGFLRGSEPDTVPARQRLTAFARPRDSSDALPEEVLARAAELEEARLEMPDEPRFRERTHGVLLPEESRLLLDSRSLTRRIYGVPCAKGWVAWFVPGRSGASCADRLRDGTAAAFNRQGKELIVHGLVPGGTVSVRIRTVHAEHEAEVGESAFLAVLHGVGTAELRELVIEDGDQSRTHSLRAA